jgi:hypothetical protein
MAGQHRDRHGNDEGQQRVRAHVFVDETKEHCYLVAAAVVQPNVLTATRQSIKSLIMPRQRRLHFESESNARRDKILAAYTTGPDISAVIYDASSYRKDRDARAACLRSLVGDLREMQAERLVLETDDPALQEDKRILYQEVRKAGIEDLTYMHMRAYEECLLAIPDAIAWCWRRGGIWRAKVAPLVTSVNTV